MISILIDIAGYILNLLKWAVILAAVLSTLVSFGVLDTRNRMVWTIGDFLYRVTEPILRPIRNVMPNFGGVDLSPLVAIVIIWALEEMLGRLRLAIAYGNVQALFL